MANPAPALGAPQNPPPPTPSSLYTQFTSLELVPKIILTGLIVLVPSLLLKRILKFLHRWLLGIFYYYLEYYRSFRGNGELGEKCNSIMRVQDPWNELRNKDWFLRRRCEGNENGWFVQQSLGIVEVSAVEVAQESSC